MSCAAQQKKDPDGDPFDMNNVKGPVKLKKRVELQPFEQTEVWGYTQVRGHSKRIVVCTVRRTFDERTSDECQLQIRTATSQLQSQGFPEKSVS